MVENVCNAEQDFCMRFFFLDADAKVPGVPGAGPEGRGRGAGAS